MNPALGIADAEAALWVFFSDFTDPAGTYSLYLNLVGLDYGRMKGQRGNHLLRVWLPGLSLHCFPDGYGG